MSRCPKCQAPLLPCCGKCPGEGHDARCFSKEAQQILARLAKQAKEDAALLERAVGRPPFDWRAGQ